MYVVSHTKGVFHATEALQRAGEKVKWNKLQGGDWDIPQSAKTEYLCCSKRQLVVLIYRFNMLLLTLHGPMNKDTAIVYISPKLSRVEFCTSQHQTTLLYLD